MVKTGRTEKSYKVIALDMDGTVLDDNKHQSMEVSSAINEALKQGYEVVYCTGRAPSEMDEFLQDVPDMRYMICESGAYICDLKEKKVISQTVIARDKLISVRNIADNDTQMVLAFNDGVVRMRNDEKVIEQFCRKFSSVRNLIKYWDRICSEPLLDYLLDNGRQVEKVNIYHLSDEEKLSTLKKLIDADLGLELVYSDMNSIEISPPGMSKAWGLDKLCTHLGISIKEVAMVGDADNDLEALKVAGLPIAMGNANERVKSISRIIVADNNHNGCAEAIHEILKTDKE